MRISQIGVAAVASCRSQHFGGTAVASCRSQYFGGTAVASPRSDKLSYFLTRHESMFENILELLGVIIKRRCESPWFVGVVAVNLVEFLCALPFQTFSHIVYILLARRRAPFDTVHFVVELHFHFVQEILLHCALPFQTCCHIVYILLAGIRGCLDRLIVGELLFQFVREISLHQLVGGYKQVGQWAMFLKEACLLPALWTQGFRVPKVVISSKIWLMLFSGG